MPDMLADDRVFMGVIRPEDLLLKYGNRHGAPSRVARTRSLVRGILGSRAKGL